MPELRAGVAAVVACLLLAAPARAQETRAGASATEPLEAEDGAPRYEAEFIASTIFQGGTVAARLRSPLTVEAHFFGVADNEIGTVGLAWSFSRNGLRIIPGFAWSFGS